MGAPCGLIGVDWGNSNLRAYRFDAAGAVVETRTAHQGTLTLQAGGHEAALARVTDGWRDAPEPRFVLCGAVGSREGWRETPYAPCPAGLDDLKRLVVPLRTGLGPAWVMPGVSALTPERAETMRGEETKALSALVSGFDGVVASTSTHSKWVRVQGGRITGLRSFMTGELFATLKAHTLIGAVMAAGPHDAGAFDLGARRALADPAATSLLLSARAEALLGRLEPESVESYLSGLLIGAEVRGGLADLQPDTPIRLIGDMAMMERTARALALAGRSGVAVIDGDVAAAEGLWMIGRTLQ